MRFKENSIELSRKIVLWQIFIGHRSAWFPLFLSACRLVEFDTAVICHVFMHCLGPGGGVLPYMGYIGMCGPKG